MSISQKLESIFTIKTLIRNAIADKGVDINSNTPFSEYPTKISMIKGSTSDVTPPVIDYFNLTINVDKSLTLSGKTEAGSTAKVTTPNNTIVNVTVNNDGTFSTTVPTSLAGIYTLVVSDLAGNITTVLKDLKSTQDKEVETLIASIFNDGAKGLWYDPNDLSTMYQDLMMTQPVTTVGQTVSVIKSKNNNGCALTVVNASKCPKLQYNQTTKTYYLLYDGIDDSLSATGLPTSVAVNTSKVTFFYNYTLLSVKSGSYVVLAGTPLIQSINEFGQRRNNVVYGGQHYPMGDFTSDVTPAEFNYALKLNTSGIDTYRRNGVATYSQDKSVSNFTSLRVIQNQATPDCINQAFYGVVSFDRELTEDQFIQIERYMAAKSGVILP